MIRTLLTTTALAALLTTGAMAQEATPPADPNAPATETPAAPAAGDAPAAGQPMAPATETPAAETPATTETSPMDAPAATETTTTSNTRTPLVLSEGYSAMEGDQLASNILGATVYTSNADDADEIGDITDLVVDSTGNVAAVVIGVGGFLGIGEKNVAVDFGELQWTPDDDGEGRYVLNTTAEALEGAPAFEYDDESADEQAENVDPNATQVAAPETTTEPAAEPAEGETTTETAESPAAGAIDRTTLQDFDETTMTAEELNGTRVFGINDEEIGVISDFVLAEGGEIDAVIVDVGGFLGLGRKPVAVGFEGLNFSVDADNNRYLFLNTTQEQLEAQPEFNSETYAAERDSQRLVVQQQ